MESGSKTRQSVAVTIRVQTTRDEAVAFAATYGGRLSNVSLLVGAEGLDGRDRKAHVACITDREVHLDAHAWGTANGAVVPVWETMRACPSGPSSASTPGIIILGPKAAHISQETELPLKPGATGRGIRVAKVLTSVLSAPGVCIAYDNGSLGSGTESRKPKRRWPRPLELRSSSTPTAFDRRRTSGVR